MDHRQKAFGRLLCPGVLVAIVAAVWVFGLNSTWAEARAKEGVSEQVPASIVPSEHADEVQQFAVQELSRYLTLVTGQTFPVGRSGTAHHLYVGMLPPSLPAAESEKLQERLGALQEDGFILQKLGSDVVILGKGPRGVLYGCYAYLERQGVRWYFPGKDYEVIPHHALNWNAPLDVEESPAFRDRAMMHAWSLNCPVVDWIDFAAKARLNRIAFYYEWPARDWYINQRSALVSECRQRGMTIEVGGHFLSKFLPRTLFPEHPDWFRLNEQGKRTNDFNFNPFNSAALDYLGVHAIKYLEQMPEASLYHLWPDDIEGGGWTHEPGKEDYTPSDQSLLVANNLIKRLRKVQPDAHLAFLAYHDTVYPPRVVKPDSGIVFWYAPRERCYAHSLNDPQCSLNRQYRQALEGALPTFGSANAEVYEYYVDEILFENMTIPLLPDVLSADARYYHQLGIPALGALMTNTSEFVSPAVNMFLYPQALWNPERDLHASLKEYAALYFGDASLDAYLRELEQGLKDVVKICDYSHPGDGWDSLRNDQESEEALAYHVTGIENGLRGPLPRAASLLDAAIRNAKDPTYRSRLEREKISMDYTLLQSRLYYHLLKGEWLYRISKREKRTGADLDAVAEAALARYTWERLKEDVTRSKLRGDPLMPDPSGLETRVSDLLGEETEAVSAMSDANPEGFAIYPVYEQLKGGVGGSIAAGPGGSCAVLWADLPGSHRFLRAQAKGVQWRDEFGQPWSGENIELATAPVVAVALGMAEDKLFDALAVSQREGASSRE
jgi:hypothetical protein